MAAQPRNPLSVDAALGNQDFANEQQGLLDLIDKLQFAQLDNVKLPQIVVVGDQSAGKSSVLEAVTGIPFPREAGACTRFATEIRLRRDSEESFSIRILPHKDRDYPEQVRLRQFGGTVDKSTSFEDLMRHAVDQIAPKDIRGRFATKDILVVSKSGPKMPLLTLVDLPGLVRIANNDQSKEDIKAIEDLTDRYMKSPRTIILAVVGGNQDYVQAPILEKARKFDPTGGRTIGVLTKPDLTELTGLEDKFITLVNNNDKENEFKLGWYVLMNPGPRDPGQSWPSAEERKQKEDEFFMRGKWSTLLPSMRGVNALKQKLSVQLQRHIGKHIRTLRKEIQKALDNCEAELKSLGAGKDTVEEMRDELVGLFEDSNHLVIPVVDGTYKNPSGKSFFHKSVDPKGTPAQKLRARAVEENKRFAERVRTQGHKFDLTSTSDSLVTKVKNIGGMTKEQYARKEVEPLLQQNTGTQFPMDHEPRLVYTLFQGYSENWSRLAQEHKDNLGAFCNAFLGEVIDSVWPHRMREPLRINFLDPQMKEMLEKARKEADLLRQDQEFEVQPYDPEYEDRVKTWRAEASKVRPYTEAEEFLEKMLIYYELSAKIFIRNVITQVVERHLLQGLYRIFSSVKVTRMANEKVTAIAAENEAVRNKRLDLKAKKAAIEEARDICANLAMRKELRTYSEDEPDNAEEGSGEEDLGPPLPRQQPASPKPSPVAGSPTSTPRKSQQQPLREKQSQTTPVKTGNKTNGSVDSGYNTGFEFAPETPAAGNYSNAEPDLSQTPGGWKDAPTAENHPSPVPSMPQYAPPAPPRQDPYRHQMDDQYYSPLPPHAGSSSRATPRVQEQYPVQSSTPEVSGHGQRRKNSYPPPDMQQYTVQSSTQEVSSHSHRYKNSYSPPDMLSVVPDQSAGSNELLGGFDYTTGHAQSPKATKGSGWRNKLSSKS